MEGKMNCKWHLQILWNLDVLIIKFIAPQAIFHLLPDELCQSLLFTFVAIVLFFQYPLIFQILSIFTCPWLQESDIHDKGSLHF